MARSGRDILPRHVGIILDGNGRWARTRGLPRIVGHREGAKAVKTTVTACRRLGVEVLTLYAFSSQNWLRPSLEVEALMALLFEYLKSERSTILDNGIRLISIGEIDRLPRVPRESLFDLMEASSSNSDMILCLCLSYGGQEEIVAGARRLAELVLEGDLSPDSIDKEVFESSLWSSTLGPVDLLIRTSGELRISNFLLWSLAYAELFFADCMWPDFDESVLDAAFRAYSKRHRRFGSIG